MSSFFTDNIRQRIFTTPTLFNSAALEIVFFRQAPAFDSGDTRFTAVETLADLEEFAGWERIGETVDFTTAGSVKKVGKNNYILYSRVPFTDLSTSLEVRAMAVLLGGDIVFVTNSPFLADPTVIHPLDGLTSNPDISLLPVPPPESNNRWLFSYADAPTGGTTIVAIVEGPLAISQGAPTFEASHTQHAWLFPQRANMIANPSFEKPGMGYWSSNGTPSRVSLPKPSAAVGSWAGRFTKGAGPPLVVESNVFPTYGEEHWTVQFLAKGVGRVKVGFVWWDATFEATVVDWGVETWDLNSSSFTHIAICRSAVQTYQGMVRIECDGNDITIDQVLCEKGFLKDWPYFDGDFDYGARNDYTWYGGQTRQGASYSLWYNNQRAIHGRLFARETDDLTKITDEDLEGFGFVYKWVPAGTIVIPHIGVLHENDLMLPVPTKVPTSYVPYKTDEDDYMGVTDPW